MILEMPLERLTRASGATAAAKAIAPQVRTEKTVDKRIFTEGEDGGLESCEARSRSCGRQSHVPGAPSRAWLGPGTRQSRQPASTGCDIGGLGPSRARVTKPIELYVLSRLTITRVLV